MKINWKQIFCNHLYRFDESILLHQERNVNNRSLLYNVYAIKSICIKCSKVKYEKAKRLVA